MPPPLSAGPPPPLPPPLPEEGYQVTTTPIARVPVENLPQASYYIPDAFGGHIISPDGIVPANPKVFLENVNLQA